MPAEKKRIDSLAAWHKVSTQPLTNEYVAEVNKWLESDEAWGGFDCLPMPRADEPTVVYFEDPDVAFAFKMRFG